MPAAVCYPKELTKVWMRMSEDYNREDASKMKPETKSNDKRETSVMAGCARLGWNCRPSD